ncbi:hypothetical protein HYH03_006404 [Edaphochlamys debaryana]|uniref:PsbP C-terminal domain-containing protein n=1 Tax=Edaphochlamys debaryana TaxID=47281 RepID=A0A836C1F1_9CHLO|nr:hypothetical protein HYH03_006404 [Edaphochlamys debaryana]|eukprot:KAG2495459.1 hypothetical protein HYH03_006404 [Edaphochlamys debaryana]
MALLSTTSRVAQHPSAGHRKATVAPRTRRSVAVQCSHQQQQASADVQVDRRSVLVAMGMLPLSMAGQALAEEAAPSGLAPYTDPRDGFSLAIPAGWVYGETTLPGNSSFSGATGERRTLAWFPEGANPRDVNVTLTITNVSVEFTKMGSFGTPYTFASNLVNSQDRSYLLTAPGWARGKEDVQIAKLIDATDLGNKYFVEYTVQKPPEQARHLYTVLGLGYNGVYNRLFTVTAQTLEADRGKYDATLKAIAKSLTVNSRSQI